MVNYAGELTSISIHFSVIHSGIFSNCYTTLMLLRYKLFLTPAPAQEAK